MGEAPARRGFSRDELGRCAFEAWRRWENDDRARLFGPGVAVDLGTWEAIAPAFRARLKVMASAVAERVAAPYRAHVRRIELERDAAVRLMRAALTGQLTEKKCEEIMAILTGSPRTKESKARAAAQVVLDGKVY